MLESLFNKVAGPQAKNFIKKRLQHKCFPVSIAKFLRTFILKKICERMRLNPVLYGYMYHKKILQRSYFRKIVLPISTQLYIVKSHTRKWDQGPGTSTGGTPGPLTRDPKMSKWDPRPGTPKWDPKPGTPKVGPRTRDPKIIK